MKKRNTGPSPTEIRLKTELDVTRLELKRLKRENEAVATAGGPRPGKEAPADPGALQKRIQELEHTRERLSRLYFSQLDENKRQAVNLRTILRAVGEISAEPDLAKLLDRAAAAVQSSLGFRIVLIRLREPGSGVLRAAAFAGLGPQARGVLEAREVAVDEFQSWLNDDCKVGRSWFIGHGHPSSGALPPGYVADLGRREEWEWHADDVLLVPMRDAAGEIVGYFSVDDPVDRLVPSQDAIELLEIFAAHTVIAIDRARAWRQIELRERAHQETDHRVTETSRLKEQFVSTISHELRTPLTAIQAYVDTLLATQADDLPAERLRHFLQVIDDESQRLARLIESVLDLNRFDSGRVQSQQQRFDLAEVLEETLWVLRRMSETRQVEVKLEVAAADTHLEADRDQMRQLILHLGSNAVKFTPVGGQVTLRLAGDERHLVLQVEDTGIGIPEDALEKIFDRFYQVDSSIARRYGGSGLGLSICKTIVDGHGGQIRARSMPERGSCFTVMLQRRMKPRVHMRPSVQGAAKTRDVLRLAIEMVSEVMNARVVSLMAPEADGSLVIQAARGLDEAVVREARVRPGSGVAGWVAEHRRPVCVSRPEEDGGDLTGRASYRTGTFLSVPLQDEQELLAVLNVTDPSTGRPFQPEDCNLLLELAEAISHAWLEARHAEAGEALAADTTEALRRMVEHVKQGRQSAPNRVRLAQAIAQELGLGAAETSRIALAATVHDVGMTLVDPDILDGGQPLTDEGRERMRRHVEMGAEVLERFETMDVVRDVVVSHHEWWDGSGYPRGLEGAAIPTGARVLALVDAFESMTLGRAHRAPRTRAEAVEEIRRLRGQQFDPDVVDAFERVLPSLDGAGTLVVDVAAQSQTSCQTGR